jgi:Sap, sulfolipid-1-addressing protein
VLLQATGLALLAALSPTALLIVAVYLGSARPRYTAMLYLLGAVAMSLVTGVLILVVLRSARLSRPDEHTPRYALRLGLGILLLVAGVIIARRKPRQTDPAQTQQPGFVYRLAANPAPLSAFLVGVLVFAPGATFLAALQVIATARASVQLTALAVIIVVVTNALLVWAPIILHALVPQATTRYLMAFNGWLRAHGKAILAGVLIVVGGIMLGNGTYGLVVS